MLRDNGTESPRPYSFARVQLAWWTVIILVSFISTIILRGGAPTFNTSTLYLLGISSATTIGATLIDISDQANPAVTTLGQNMTSSGFFLDILSDKNGVNVHRFQTVVFNIVFGLWFIYEVLCNLKTQNDINYIMPVITSNNLILLGVSSGVYAALKTTENKQVTAFPAPPRNPGPDNNSVAAASPAGAAAHPEIIADEAKPQG